MIDTLAIIKKYYTPGSLAYTSLVTHCKLVAQKAVYFARKHPELALDITFVEEAAMLHDIGIFKIVILDINDVLIFVHAVGQSERNCKRNENCCSSAA